MNSGTALLYLAAAVLFIVGLKMLSSPRRARRGNLIAGAGMLLAVVVTLVDADIVEWWAVVLGLAIGAAVGGVAAYRVQMTEMPEMVAAFNGFGGAASALVAASEFVRLDADLLDAETIVTILLSLLIGTVTFSGSFIAFGKLRGMITGRPVTYPGRQLVNAVLVAAIVGFSIWGIADPVAIPFWVVTGLALLLGILMVIPIGGADMPVVISLLNSFSGLAASAAGFVIENTALIIGGALVGAAGLILTTLMCDAMNRSLWNVIVGGFGGADSTGAGPQHAADKPVKSATAADVAIALGYADRVVIVPGYGLAVAQAQHACAKLAAALEDRGVEVSYAIHPVAGRMPGHMNVLLAEADVDYEKLRDLDEINPEFPQTDVALIVGANDVVNPSARDDASSPIYGMPILDVDRSGNVVVVKRSLSPGFAGIDNPLFYNDNTMMFFSDAKKALEDVVGALEEV